MKKLILVVIAIAATAIAKAVPAPVPAEYYRLNPYYGPNPIWAIVISIGIVALVYTLLRLGYKSIARTAV